MLGLLVVLFLFIALVGYLIGAYNGLVQVRAGVKLAWSNIDVLLVQRHDELPKLVEVCKQYMQYEPGTLERVMKARAGVDAASAHRRHRLPDLQRPAIFPVGADRGRYARHRPRLAVARSSCAAPDRGPHHHALGPDARGHREHLAHDPEKWAPVFR